MNGAEALHWTQRSCSFGMSLREPWSAGKVIFISKHDWCQETESQNGNQNLKQCEEEQEEEEHDGESDADLENQFLRRLVKSCSKTKVSDTNGGVHVEDRANVNIDANEKNGKNNRKKHKQRRKELWSKKKTKQETSIQAWVMKEEAKDQVNEAIKTLEEKKSWKECDCFWIICDEIKNICNESNNELNNTVQSWLEFDLASQLVVDDDCFPLIDLDIAWRLGRSIRSAGLMKGLVVDKTGNKMYLGTSTENYKKAVVKTNHQNNKKNNDQTKPNDTKPKARTGWGAGRQQTRDRFLVFRNWLVERYGKENLLSGTGILDVAGGKGHLSFTILHFLKIPTTIVDPRPLNVVSMLQNVTYKLVQRLKEKNDNPDSKIVRVALPEHIRCCCWYPLDVETNLSKPKGFEDYTGDRLEDSIQERTRLLKALESCSAIVGMHSDQATEAIVDWGLHLGKPFATVPCCVFPNLFQHRVHVRSHAAFCKYLVDKDPEKVVSETLGFSGRNTVIASAAKDPPSPPPSDGIVVPSWSQLAKHLKEVGEADHGDLVETDGLPSLLDELNSANGVDTDVKKEATRARARDNDIPESIVSSWGSADLSQNAPLRQATKTQMNMIQDSFGLNGKDLVSWTVAFFSLGLFDSGNFIAGMLLFIVRLWWIGRKTTVKNLLEMRAHVLEDLIASSIYQIKQCELNKRGYQLSARFLPPIARLEMNEYLKNQKSHEFQLCNFRGQLIDIIHDSILLYSNSSNDSSVNRTIMSMKRHELLICEMESLLLRLAKQRCTWFRKNDFERNKSAARKILSSLTLLIDRLPKQTIDTSRSSGDGGNNKKRHSKNCQFVVDKLDAARSQVLSLNSWLLTESERLKFNQEAECSLKDIEALLAKCKHLQENALSQLDSAHAYVLRQSSLGGKGVQKEGEDEEKEQEQVQVQDNERTLNQDQIEQEEHAEEADHFTQVFQGLIEKEENRRKEKATKSKEGDSDEEDIDCDVYHETVNSMFGELETVLEHKKKELAPEKVVRGANITQKEEEEEEEEEAEKEKEIKSNVPPAISLFGNNNLLLSELAAKLENNEVTRDESETVFEN